MRLRTVTIQQSKSRKRYRENYFEVVSLESGWSPRVSRVELTPYGMARGIGGALLRVCRSFAPLRNLPPTVVRVSTRP